MKKVLSLVAILAALAGTASAAPYYLPQPAGGALTPYDIQPVYSIEGIYNFVQDGPDTYGARLNFSLYSSNEGTVRHQVTLSAGYETGRETRTEDIFSYKVDLERMPITLGYDVNIALTDNILIDLGVKMGYAEGVAEVTYNSPEEYAGMSDTEHMGGFTYGLTAGIKVELSESVHLKLAYEFGRTFFRHYGDRSINLNQHGIVFGVGCLF